MRASIVITVLLLTPFYRTSQSGISYICSITYLPLRFIFNQPIDSSNFHHRSRAFIIQFILLEILRINNFVTNLLSLSLPQGESLNFFKDSVAMAYSLINLLSLFLFIIIIPSLFLLDLCVFLWGQRSSSLKGRSLHLFRPCVYENAFMRNGDHSTWTLESIETNRYILLLY